MDSRRFSLLCALAATLGLASCASDSSITLDYVPPPGGAPRGAPEFTVGAFANKRSQDSRYLGTVKLPLGVSLEHLNSTSPVETVVANAVAPALENRGMLTDSDKARFLITGDVLDLHAELLVHPYASAKVRMNVVEVGSGRVLFSKVYSAERKRKGNERLLSLAYSSLRKRVAKALVDIHGKFNVLGENKPIEISREDIAHYVGTATESLIRTLSDS